MGKDEKPATRLEVSSNYFPYKTLWAYLSVDEKDNEGIMAVKTDGGSFPLVTGDPENLELIKKTFLKDIKAEIETTGIDRKVHLGVFTRTSTEEL